MDLVRLVKRFVPHGLEYMECKAIRDPLKNRETNDLETTGRQVSN